MSKKVQKLPPGKPNPVDVHVGKHLRLRRTLLGISQTKLGDAIGLTFHQVQKNERGANRIGASRLYELSQILDVPISYFFEDMPDELKTHEGRFKLGMKDAKQKALNRTRWPAGRRWSSSVRTTGSATPRPEGHCSNW